MRERLWRRTLLLTREYPPLWLPVMVADLAGFAFRSSRRAAPLFVARLMLPMLHGHSALMGSTAPDGLTLRGPVLVVASLVGFVLASSQIVFYVIALFVTARMVWRIAPGSPNDGRFTTKGMVELSIRGLIAAVGVGIVDGLLLWVVMNTRSHALAQQWIPSVLISAVTMSMFAWLLVPPALRLLADPAKSPDKHSIRLGRHCAIAAVIASAALITMEHIVPGNIYGSHGEILGLGAIESLLAALPYVPLYIALALLATRPIGLPSKHIVLVSEET